MPGAMQNPIGGRMSALGVLSNSLSIGRILTLTGILTTGTSITIPTGVTQCLAIGCGGGGAGGGADGGTYSGGRGGSGGGGAISQSYFDVMAGKSISYVLGAGGTGVIGATGLAGGATTVSYLGSLVLSADGGKGGLGASAPSPAQAADGVGGQPGSSIGNVYKLKGQDGNSASYGGGSAGIDLNGVCYFTSVGGTPVGSPSVGNNATGNGAGGGPCWTNTGNLTGSTGSSGAISLFFFRSS